MQRTTADHQQPHKRFPSAALLHFFLRRTYTQRVPSSSPPSFPPTLLLSPAGRSSLLLFIPLISYSRRWIYRGTSRVQAGSDCARLRKKLFFRRTTATSARIINCFTRIMKYIIVRSFKTIVLSCVSHFAGQSPVAIFLSVLPLFAFSAPFSWPPFSFALSFSPPLSSLFRSLFISRGVAH